MGSLSCICSLETSFVCLFVCLLFKIVKLQSIAEHSVFQVCLARLINSICIRGIECLRVGRALGLQLLQCSHFPDEATDASYVYMIFSLYIFPRIFNILICLYSLFECVYLVHSHTHTHTTHTLTHTTLLMLSL